MKKIKKLTFFFQWFLHLVEWASSMESALNSVSIATKLQFWIPFCTLGRISSKLCLVTSHMTFILDFLKIFLHFKVKMFPVFAGFWSFIFVMILLIGNLFCESLKTYDQLKVKNNFFSFSLKNMLYKLKSCMD